MKIKTSELRDLALNFAVEMIECEGAMYSGRECRPFSTDWAQGGPIIERERIRIEPRGVWCAAHDSFEWGWMSGPTPLVAAMRCYVASKLGDEVDVPGELTQGEEA